MKTSLSHFTAQYFYDIQGYEHSLMPKQIHVSHKSLGGLHRNFCAMPCEDSNAEFPGVTTDINNILRLNFSPGFHCSLINFKFSERSDHHKFSILLFFTRVSVLFYFRYHFYKWQIGNPTILEIFVQNNLSYCSIRNYSQNH